MNKLNHVALIMDGNGRWAQLRHRPRSFGHIKGSRVSKSIIIKAADLGLKYLTLYAFSAENWQRPSDEVHLLMRLLERYLKRETNNFIKKNIKMRVIGNLDDLPENIRKSILESTGKTKNCTGLEVCFAISYGSRQEMLNCVKVLVEKKLEINETNFSNHLQTYGMPDPDLIIRTSGEQRLSNFLLWQSAYSELMFTDTLWPDFTENEFESCLFSFQNRKRRFGKVESISNEQFN